MEDCCLWVPIFLQWLLVAIQSSKVTSYRRSLGGTFGCWGLYGIDHDWPVSERGFLDVLCHHINYWLAVWNHGILYDFPYIGNFVIPTDEVIFFQRGRSTTNQIINLYHLCFLNSHLQRMPLCHCKSSNHDQPGPTCLKEKRLDTNCWKAYLKWNLKFCLSYMS